MDESRLDKLVRRAGDRDDRAFGEIYDEFAQRVYAYVRGRLSDPVEAEDVTAEVFLKAWEALPRYDSRGVPFSAWLFRIARNAVVDAHRQDTRRPPTADASEADAIPGPYRVEADVLDSIDAAELRRYVAKLTEPQAEVVALRFFAGFSPSETARITGRTEGAVKAMQHRAIATLARMLGSESGDDRTQ